MGGWGGVGLGNSSDVVVAVAAAVAPLKWVFLGKRFLHDWASEQRSRRATAWKRLVWTSRIFFVFMTNVRNLINCLFSRENVYFKNRFSYFKKIVKNPTPCKLGFW